jgi:hypothetical protein
MRWAEAFVEAIADLPGIHLLFLDELKAQMTDQVYVLV